MTSCIAIGTTMHGKYKYLTVVQYNAITNKKGVKVWQKGEVFAQATTMAKIKRLAEEKAQELALPMMPRVRHNDPVEAAR